MKKKKIVLAFIFFIVIIARYSIGRYEFQQEQRVTEIFIIRGLASSYMDFNLKFFLVITLIAIILYDWKKNIRLDYFWIGLICSLGIFVEGLVQLTGERVLLTNYLFGIELPYLIQLPLQVLAESSFDTVMVLFFADFMLKEKTRKKATVAFTVVMIIWLAFIFSSGIQTPNYGGEVASRRVISGTGELAIVLLGAFVVLAFFLTKENSRYLLATLTNQDKRRGLYLLILLIIYGFVGTIGMNISGGRWIEIGVKENTQHANPLIEIVGFAYNVIFEYAFAYLLAYTIPVGLKLIKLKRNEE